MIQNDMLRKLDELLEFDPGTLTGDEKLSHLEGWDSLAVLGFMALVDETFEITVSPKAIESADTVHDLLALAHP